MFSLYLYVLTLIEIYIINIFLSLGKQYVIEKSREFLTMDDDDLSLQLVHGTINVENSDYQLIKETKSTVLAGKLFYFNALTLER